MPSATGLPFDDIRRLLTLMPGADEDAVAAVRRRRDERTVAPGALGRLDAIVEWLAAWQGRGEPTLNRPLVCIFAASHGVAARGLSWWPPASDRARMETVSAGGAAINQICAAHDLGLKIFDLALDLPTPDIANGAALDEAGCAATMAFGMEAIADGADLLCVGDLGAGASASASAICAALYGGPVERWAARDSGVDDATAGRVRALVADALACHAGHLGDPLEVLRRLGGRDIAAIAGAILAARLQRIPVLLDGHATVAAAAVLHALDARAIDHCMAGHGSAGAHAAALKRLGLEPLLALDLDAGEGAGAAIAAGIVRVVLRCHRGMATFEQAKIARPL